MGYYINTDSKGELIGPWGKADDLIADGATEIPTPTEWQPNLVCVVSNGPFDAAAYAFDADEMRVFLDTKHDKRPRRWLIVPDAAKLAGYEGRV